MGIFIHRFNEAFDGVVLAYDEKFQSDKAKILSGIVPYFGVRLKAKLLLFSPKPDMLLGNFHHCLALQFFSFFVERIGTDFRKERGKRQENIE